MLCISTYVHAYEHNHMHAHKGMHQHAMHPPVCGHMQPEILYKHYVHAYKQPNRTSMDTSSVTGMEKMDICTEILKNLGTVVRQRICTDMHTQLFKQKLSFNGI